MKSADAKALAKKERDAERKKKKDAKNSNPNTFKGRLTIAQKTGQVNEKGPFGNRTYKTDKDGRTTATNDLGEQQALFEQQLARDEALGKISQSQLASLQQSMSQPFSLSHLGNDPTQFNYQAQRDAAEKRVYDRFAARNEPRFQKELKDFDAKMAAQGVPQGSDKYNELKLALSREQQDQRDSASTQAFQLGGAEEAQAYGQGLQSRQQGISEYGQTRSAPYSDMAAVLGLQKGLMLPQFTNPGAVDGAGIASQLQQESIAKAASRGGGGPAPEPFSLQTDPVYQRWLAQQQYIKQNPVKGPSMGQQMGQIVGGAVGPMAGAALGTWLAS